METDVIGCKGARGENLDDESCWDHEWTNKAIISTHLKENELENFSRYKMNHPKRGIALIIFNANFKNRGLPERVGSQEDVECLRKTFMALDFEVRLRKDLTLADMWKEIDKVAKEDHTNNDCLLIAIKTHGEDDGTLFATDYKFKRDNITERFESERVPSLAGKPKIFLFETCRGWKQEESVSCMMSHRATWRTDSVSTRCVSIPTTADFLLVYSSMKGRLSWAHKKKGSWFIQDLCTELNKDARTKDILSIVTNTLRRVALTRTSNTHDAYSSGRQQMPVFVSTLTSYREKGFLQDESKLIPTVLDGEEIGKSSMYKMNPSKRGIALIFNNENFKQNKLGQRCGAAEDGRAVSDTMKKMGFEVRLHNDTTMNEMWEEIDLVAKMDHSNHKCLVAVFMTHGEDNDYLYATDYRFKIDDVIERFTSDRVPSLAGKPKIFFFEASRGMYLEESVPCPMITKESWMTGSETTIHYVPSSAEFLIVDSCMEDCHSWRNLEKSSQFIQALCKALKEDARTKDILSILTSTLRSVVVTRHPTEEPSGIQMPVFTSTLTRFLYFSDPKQ